MSGLVEAECCGKLRPADDLVPDRYDETILVCRAGEGCHEENAREDRPRWCPICEGAKPPSNAICDACAITGKRVRPPE